MLATPAALHAQGFGDADPMPTTSDIVAEAPEASGRVIVLASLASPPVAARPTTPAQEAVGIPDTAPLPSASVSPDVATAMPEPDTAPRSACLEAVRWAEARHDLPDGLLVAIALNESGLHSYALSIRGQPHYPRTRAQAAALYRAARGAVMAGCVQVNARVHARGTDWPLDPQQAADWAGAFLQDAYARTGSWAEAIRLWHGGRPGTARWLACRIRAKMDVTAPDSGLFRDLHCVSGAWAAQLRRNGQAHYEIALAE